MKTRFLIKNHHCQAFDKKNEVKIKRKRSKRKISILKSCSTDVGKPFTNDLFQPHITFSAQNLSQTWSEDFPK